MANYHNIARPGMRADASLFNVDGCNAAQGKIYPGLVVATVSADNDKRVVKQVSASADGSAVMGVCLFSHDGCIKSYYDDKDPMNVVTFGRIWVVTTLTAAPSHDSAVSVLTSGDDAGKVASTGGTAIPGWTYTGEFWTHQDDLGNSTNIAVVQIRNQTATSSNP